MKDAEVIARCVPIDVALECPYCKEENEYDYSEYCLILTVNRSEERKI